MRCMKVHRLKRFRWICDFYAQGKTYSEVHEQTRSNLSKYAQYIENTSFKFIVDAFNNSVPKARQREVVESFSYMALLGKIDMKTPEVTFMCFEECKSGIRIAW